MSSNIIENNNFIETLCEKEINYLIDNLFKKLENDRIKSKRHFSEIILDVSKNCSKESLKYIEEKIKKAEAFSNKYYQRIRNKYKNLFDKINVSEFEIKNTIAMFYIASDKDFQKLYTLYTFNYFLDPTLTYLNNKLSTDLVFPVLHYVIKGYVNKNYKMLYNFINLSMQNTFFCDGNDEEMIKMVEFKFDFIIENFINPVISNITTPVVK